jgi:hypothetical protein
VTASRPFSRCTSHIGSLGRSHKDQGVQSIFCGSRHNGRLTDGRPVPRPQCDVRESLNQSPLGHIIVLNLFRAGKPFPIARKALARGERVPNRLRGNYAEDLATVC